MQGTRLVIGQTWHGQPLPPAERATLDFRASGGDLEVRVDSPYRADPPPEAPPGSVDELYRYEVVELFLLGEGERYLEIELGPGGHYWVLQLEGYRKRIRAGLPIEHHARILGDRWSGVARIDARLLPRGLCAANAYALHGPSALRQHLVAHRLPGDAPDFHLIGDFPRWTPPAGLSQERGW